MYPRESVQGCFRESSRWIRSRQGWEVKGKEAVWRECLAVAARAILCGNPSGVVIIVVLATTCQSDRDEWTCVTV